MTERLDIIIPVYNEGSNIQELLRSIRDKISVSNIIYIIYDFDADDTLPVIENIAEEFSQLNIHTIKNEYNPGVVGAIKTGIKASSNQLVLITMADLSDDLGIVETMLAKLRQGCSVVCASRYMPGGQSIGGSNIKRLMSQFCGRSLYFLTGIGTHDITNNFKLYKRDLLKRIKIESRGGFEIGMEITIKAFLLGEKVAEIPTTWKERSAGKSKFKLLLWFPGYVKWYLRATILRVFYR